MTRWNQRYNKLYLNKLAKEKKVSLFQYHRIPQKENSNYRNHVIHKKNKTSYQIMSWNKGTELGSLTKMALVSLSRLTIMLTF